MEPTKLAELRVKHLEMIQGIISRLSGQAATNKNYCITLVSALSGFAVTFHQPMFTLLAILPIAIFAALDAQYLRIERQYRMLFDQTRRENWGDKTDFDLALKSPQTVKYVSALISWSITAFYGPLTLGIVGITVTERLWLHP